MNTQPKKERPPIVLVTEFTPALADQLKQRGLWRCACVLPNCTREPYAEVMRVGKGVPKGLRSLFCLAHARQYALAIGHVLPEPGDN